MADNLQITMLPAKEGDCLVIAYGDDTDKRYILIDSGRSWTYKNALKKYLEEHNISEPDLLVITHVDRDHIDGMDPLMKDDLLELDPGDVWFNCRAHLEGEKVVNPVEEETIEEFGAKMGEELSSEIIEKKWPWNHYFEGAAVECAEDTGDNRIQMGDISLTLLSPSREKLGDLIDDWDEECEKAGIIPGGSVEDYIVLEYEMEAFGAIDIDELAEEEFEDDHSTANGSSIAFVLEYKNRRLLLSGDAHADMLIESLNKMGVNEENPLELDVFKIPHHGSKHNISKELLGLLKCDHYLVSTNGNYFKHPDKVAMARIIKYGTAGATIHFNYKTDHNEIWEDEGWKEQYKYDTDYPPEDQDGYLCLDFSVEV